MEATHAIARSRAASFIGMPTQSPSSVLPVLSSSRTGVHSPDRSTPRATVLTCSGYCCACIDIPTKEVATRTVSSAASGSRCMGFLRSEGVLQPELQDPRTARRQNLTERRLADILDRIVADEVV